VPLCISRAEKYLPIYALVTWFREAYDTSGYMQNHEHRESLTDIELLHSIGDGCSDCFALLFHRYFRQVFSLAYRIIRDRSEAEEVLQEVFLAIYLQQERFDPTRGSVRTWILHYAYFKALLRMRYLRVRNFYKNEEITQTREIRSTQVSALFGMNLTEWSCYVEKGISSLTKKQQQTIELVHFDSHTLQETSQILRESLANTRNNYYRGIKALRGILRAKVGTKRAQEDSILEGGRRIPL
jgi:RNA polymerase sigma-70 factor, ECF subfamily